MNPKFHQGKKIEIKFYNSASNEIKNKITISQQGKLPLLENIIGPNIK